MWLKMSKHIVLPVQDGQTEAEIKQYVDNICLKMPKAVRLEPLDVVAH